MSHPPTKTPAQNRSLGIYRRLRAARNRRAYWVHQALEKRLLPFVQEWFPKSIRRGYVFSDAVSNDLARFTDHFLDDVLADLVSEADWKDLHAIVFDEREAQSKKVADLNSAVDALTKCNE